MGRVSAETRCENFHEPFRRKRPGPESERHNDPGRQGASQERGGKGRTEENQQAVVQARLRTVPVREIMTAVPVTVLSPL
jgi:hypothetical protein